MTGHAVDEWQAAREVREIGRVRRKVPLLQGAMQMSEGDRPLWGLLGVGFQLALTLQKSHPRP